MSIEFEEDKFAGPQFTQNQVQEKKSGLINYLIDKGVFKNEKSANIFLLSASIILIIIAGIVSYNILKAPEVDNRSYSELSAQERLSIPADERELIQRNQNK